MYETKFTKTTLVKFDVSNKCTVLSDKLILSL